MVDALSVFEGIVRSAPKAQPRSTGQVIAEHPFETRNIHPALPLGVAKLFDDGHYAQATFEAFKFVDKEVARLSKSQESGFKLMMAALSDTTPVLKLNNLKSVTEKDEQKGFQFLFAG